MYHLAIDIGASSGRHILGSLVDGKLQLEEIYRFENNIKNENGTLIWDIENLVSEVISGIKKCNELCKIPATVAIDTWGVDYVLLDEDKKELFPVVSYRDSRTDAAEKEVASFLPQSVLYSKTGIQKQNFNTVYQLYCDKISGKLDNARHFLMIPDYLSFKLTGVIKNEYTNATTTNIVNAVTKTWDDEILSTLGIPKYIFSELSLPSTEVGDFTKELQHKVGFNAKVVLCPSHDTASAVAACPIDDESVYISSGTWSLIGTENTVPVLSDEALFANFTNEGGIEYRYRFLKNIMGMWLFQNIRRNIDKSMNYDEMMQLAQKSYLTDTIDPNHPSFSAPESMIDAVRNYLSKPDMSLSDVLAIVYHSLAQSYDAAVREIERISGKEINTIYIVGGGSKDEYLNHLTAYYTEKNVCVGLTEATATGNLISQIMYIEKLTLKEAREIVKNSFNIREVE